MLAACCLGRSACYSNLRVCPVHRQHDAGDSHAQYCLLSLRLPSQGPQLLLQLDIHFVPRSRLHRTGSIQSLSLSARALLQAVGDRIHRKGINRFGHFSAPLDEAAIEVILNWIRSKGHNQLLVIGRSVSTEEGRSS